MSVSKAIERAAANPVQLALGGALLLGVVYFLARKTVSDVAGGVRGIVSGDNEVTRGTPYESAGIFGTVGAVANEASGGTLQGIGETIGGWLADGMDALRRSPLETLPSGRDPISRPLDLSPAASRQQYAQDQFLRTDDSIFRMF